MDYKNDLRLDEREKELIDIVVNYKHIVDSETICFKDIIDKVELDTSVPKYSESETLDVKELAELLESAKIQWEKINDERWAIMEKARKASSGQEQKLLYERAGQLENQLGQINARINNIDDILANDGMIKTPLLGCFVPKDMKVYLYLDNIKRVPTFSSRPRITVYTFIHEMIHAWNFFKSGGGRSILEIDEPMTEFYSQVLLQQLENEDNAFRDILISASDTIEQKKRAVGFLASYGFGHYLYEQSKSDADVLKMLVKYSVKSSSINPCDPDVKSVKALLTPCYPISEEKKVMALFKKIIMPSSESKGDNWKDVILDIIGTIKIVRGSTFTLDDIYAFKSIIQRIFPSNNNIEAKIRQQLQDLCRGGVITRVSPGEYRIL